MTPRPSRIRGAVIAVEDRGICSYDTVRRAWWRGETLTRVVLRHLGERRVERITRVPDGQLLEGLRVMHLAPLAKKGGPR